MGHTFGYLVTGLLLLLAMWAIGTGYSLAIPLVRNFLSYRIAMGYAGLTFEDLQQYKRKHGNLPYKKLLAGVERRKNRLANRAAWLASQLRDVLPKADVVLFEHSGEVFSALLTASKKGADIWPEREAVDDVIRAARKAAGAEDCPYELSSRLREWARDASQWSRVACLIVPDLAKQVAHA